MSRFKKQRDLEKDLPKLTTAQLEAEVAYYREHARWLGPKVGKLALKTVHKLERLLQQKRSEEQDSARQS
jgi:hypothetical protein